jgi:hypothetical protein
MADSACLVAAREVGVKLKREDRLLFLVVDPAVMAPGIDF